MARVPGDRTAWDQEERAAAPSGPPIGERGQQGGLILVRAILWGDDRDGDRTGNAMREWIGGGVSNGAAVAWMTGASRGALSACPLALALGDGQPARTPPVTA
ncbi:MAG: hypothetical protein M3462_13545 [Chloroflexota bacterium]|nr:hypothetical protein [Chloroflexota bacterium]